MAEKKVGIRYEVSGQDQLKRIAEILERIEKVNLRVAASMDALTQASQKYNQASGQAKTQLDALSDATDKTKLSISQQLEVERLRIRAQRESTRAATETRKAQEATARATRVSSNATGDLAKESAQGATSLDALGRSLFQAGDQAQTLAAASKQSQQSLQDWMAAAKKNYTTLTQTKKAIKSVEGGLATLRFSQTKSTEESRKLEKEYRKWLWVLKALKKEQGEQISATRAAAAAQQKAATDTAEAERLRIRAQRENTRAATESRKTQEQVNQEVKKAERLQKQHASALAMTAKKLVLWSLGARTAFRLYMQVRNMLRETFKDLYENTEEWKRFREATDHATRAFVSATVEVSGGLMVIEWLSARLETLSQLLVLGGAGFAAAKVGVKTFYDEITQLDFDAAYETLFNVEKNREFRQAGLETFRKLHEMTYEGKNAVEEYAHEIERLMSVLKRWQSTQARWATQAGKIQTDYRQAITSATGDMFAGLHKAQVDYQKAIDKINANALKARAKAYKNYEKALSKQQEQGQDERQRAAERHALEMDFARRRFNLTSLQNERIYQYTRSRLVADGDVLAIEDLDARYEIEQKAQKENFDLQMQQADAMYQLQMKYQNEAYRQQALLLKQALGEQLREIEEERQNEVVEAKDAADEQRQITKDEWADRVATAEANAIQQEEDLDESRQRDLQNQAEYLADIVANSDLSVEQVLAGHIAVYGANGELDKLTRDYVKRNETWAKLVGDAFDGAADTSLIAAQRLTDGWAASLSLITQRALAARAAVAAIGSGGRRLRTKTRDPEPGYQYGGDTIVNQPTTFVAGEGYSPERVRVEPISPIGGGNVNLGWAGSAIPVHGTGQMDGMDLSGVGDAIAQGLVVELQRQVLSYRGKRGY